MQNAEYHGGDTSVPATPVAQEEPWITSQRPTTSWRGGSAV